MKSKKCTTKIGAVAAMVMMMFIVHSNAYSQTYKRKTPCYLGGGLENFSTGNWHGAFYSTYFNLTKGRNSFSGGPIFQKRTMDFSGGKISYSRNLSGPKKNIVEYDEEESYIPVEQYTKQMGRQLVQLNFFTFAQYIHETSLSYSAQKTEQKAERNVTAENKRDWSKVRLSTAEAGFGFELYLKITRRVSWKNYVAGSVYYHINYLDGMYQERVAPSLVLGTGVHICPF